MSAPACTSVYDSAIAPTSFAVEEQPAADQVVQGLQVGRQRLVTVPGMALDSRAAFLQFRTASFEQFSGFVEIQFGLLA